jgi:hypothetical protein
VVRERRRIFEVRILPIVFWIDWSDNGIWSFGEILGLCRRNGMVVDLFEVWGWEMARLGMRLVDP